MPAAGSPDLVGVERPEEVVDESEPFRRGTVHRRGGAVIRDDRLGEVFPRVLGGVPAHRWFTTRGGVPADLFPGGATGVGHQPRVDDVGDLVQERVQKHALLPRAGGLRAGAAGFLLKSVDQAELLDALFRVRSGSIYISPQLEFEKLFFSTGTSSPASDPIDMLSSREYQVFQLLVDGVRAKDIARRLQLSPKTIDTYRASLMRKLDIHDVAGLVKFAIQRDLTSAL